MSDHFHAIVKIIHTESGNNTVGPGRDLALQCKNPIPNNSNPSPGITIYSFDKKSAY